MESKTPRQQELQDNRRDHVLDSSRIDSFEDIEARDTRADHGAGYLRMPV